MTDSLLKTPPPDDKQGLRIYIIERGKCSGPGRPAGARRFLVFRWNHWLTAFATINNTMGYLDFTQLSSVGKARRPALA